MTIKAVAQESEVNLACQNIGCDSGEIVSTLGIQCYKKVTVAYTEKIYGLKEAPCKFIAATQAGD